MSGQTIGVNDVQPPTLDHFVGQPNAIERVRIALDAMFNQADDSTFPHALMVGPKGCGKTLMANIVARETACPFTEIVGQSIFGPTALNGLLMESEGGILFIDEIHSLHPNAQLDLLKALEQRKVCLNSASRGDPPTEIQLKPFTLLAATTEEYDILPPLLDRFRLILRFDFYSVENLCQIVHQRAKALHWQLEEGVVEMIAHRGKQTPRIALRLLESCWRTAAAENAKIITVRHFERTAELEQLDSIGCDQAEQAYLKILRDSKGKARLNVIASRLGLPTRTVECIEQYLVRQGLIDKTEQGRILTRRGYDHLGLSGPSQGA